MKMLIRSIGMRLVALFSREIRDCHSGKVLGRGFLFSFGCRIFLIGYAGRPLIPRFLSQKRLTIWRQEIGFTTYPAPDFERLPGTPQPDEGGRVLNLLLTHRGGDEFRRLTRHWERICAPENLWVAFGGSHEDFEALDWPRKVFVDDPELRKKDNQREKQSYLGIFKAMMGAVEHEHPDYIYLCEYDHLPLVDDLNARQVAEIRGECADVMGHWLDRMDGSGHYFQLYHESDPEFVRFWRAVSRRENKDVVLNMFGSGSLWSRQAFLAIAASEKPIACYLEIHLPTLAHHLGFRIRCWDEKQHLISNKPSGDFTMAKAKEQGAWTVHPVKGSS